MIIGIGFHGVDFGVESVHVLDEVAPELGDEEAVLALEHEPLVAVLHVGLERPLVLQKLVTNLTIDLAVLALGHYARPRLRRLLGTLVQVLDQSVLALSFEAAVVAPHQRPFVDRPHVGQQAPLALEGFMAKRTADLLVLAVDVPHVVPENRRVFGLVRTVLAGKVTVRAQAVVTQVVGQTLALLVAVLAEPALVQVRGFALPAGRRRDPARLLG